MDTMVYNINHMSDRYFSYLFFFIQFTQNNVPAKRNLAIQIYYHFNYSTCILHLKETYSTESVQVNSCIDSLTAHDNIL